MRGEPQYFRKRREPSFQVLDLRWQTEILQNDGRLVTTQLGDRVFTILSRIDLVVFKAALELLKEVRFVLDDE